MIFSKNKKGVVPLLLIAMLAAIGFLFAANYVSVGEITGSGGYIERPVFNWYACEPQQGGIAKTGNTTISSGGTWIEKSVASDSYTVNVLIDKVPIVGNAERIKYSVCNSKVISQSNCPLIFERIISTTSREKGHIYTLADIDTDEQLFVKYEVQYVPFGPWKEYSGAKYYVAYKPYGLVKYDVLHSGSTIINKNSCTVSTNDESWKDRFISTDSKALNSQSPGKNTVETNLEPDEKRSFISGYVTSPAADKAFITYKNQQAWCLRGSNSGDIYKVNSVTTGSGTYKIASVEYSDKIGSEQCCPGDKKPGFACNDNFKWTSTQPIDDKGTTNGECSAFNPCQAAAETPWTTKTVAKYSCVSSKCVLQTRAVECANTKDCADSNKICDANTWKCVNAGVNLAGNKIVVTPDNSVDCKTAGGVWVTDKTTSKEGSLCFAGIGICQEKTVAQSYCKMPKFNFSALAWILVIIAIGAVLIAFRGPLYGVFMSIRRTLRL